MLLLVALSWHQAEVVVKVNSASRNGMKIDFPEGKDLGIVAPLRIDGVIARVLENMVIPKFPVL